MASTSLFVLLAIVALIQIASCHWYGGWGRPRFGYGGFGGYGGYGGGYGGYGGGYGGFGGGFYRYGGFGGGFYRPYPYYY